MNNVIVGTAGHVDHGKTSLIKALTGTDADRLKEEKKRGITIELGFAEMETDGDVRIGVIDVPGHEKFIKNMLAGIGGIDVVLLVVAADEGVMPQTVEHFEIIKMLDIKRGIVAITKSDLVDEEWMEVVKDDVSDHLKGTFLENAQIIEVSAHTGKNIELLKNLICSMAKETESRRMEPELFRIPIDRVFTIDGFGTVVTGTLIEGSVAVGDSICVYPDEVAAKVRNVQVHGNLTDKAYAGQRTALNLSGIKKEQLLRGNVIANKGFLEPSMMIDVKINMFKDSPRELVSGSRLHFYCGSEEMLCKAVLLDADVLSKGQSGYAQLRLEGKVAVRKNDRFILRFYSPLESIGGGVILNPTPHRRKRFDEDVLNGLKIRETGTAEDIVERISLEQGGNTPEFPELGRLSGLSKNEMTDVLKSLVCSEKITFLSENIWIHHSFWELACEKATSLLSSFHEEKPFRQGMPKEEFRGKIGKQLLVKNDKVSELILSEMAKQQIILDEGSIVSMPGFNISYSPQTALLKEKIENEYRKLGVEAPDIEEFSLTFKEKERQSVKEIAEALAGEGQMVKLSHNNYIHADCYKDAYALLEAHIKSKAKITLSEYRDMLNTSRKFAIRLLEYFDRKKITRLEDDARVFDN